MSCGASLYLRVCNSSLPLGDDREEEQQEYEELYDCRDDLVGLVAHGEDKHVELPYHDVHGEQGECDGDDQKPREPRLSVCRDREREEQEGEQANRRVEELLRL